MYDKKIFIKSALLLAFPVILQNSITMVVNMLDTFMLSSYGEVQVSASSQANAFISIFQYLCMGIGSGGAVLTAQLWGSKKIDDIKETITIIFKLSLVTSAIFGLVIYFAPDLIMKIYSPDDEVVEYGIIYLKWSIPTFICMAISLGLVQVFRSIREVKIPLYASITSVFTNLVGNWIFIYGNLGAPEMQIAGAAIGTVIARIVEVFILLFYLFKVDKKIQYKIKDILASTSGLMNTFLKYSMPVAFSDLLLGIGTSATSVIIGHIGTNYAAASSVVQMIQRVATVFSQGLGNASHTLIGNTIGDRKYDEAVSQSNILLSMAFIFGIIASIIIFSVGIPVVDYFESFAIETKKIAYELIYALTIIVIFQAVQSVITKGILRGGGDTEYCLKMDSTFLWLVSIPLGYYVGIVLRLDPFWCMISLHADWIIKTFVGLKRVYSKKWIKDIDN